MKKFDYLYSLLVALPPDLESIENELKSNSFSSEDITRVACDFADECFCEYRGFLYEKGRVPEDSELHSTYIYDICKLLLKYGLNPNLIISEDAYSEDNIMHSIYWIDKPYVSADTLRLLLENGGDPGLWIYGDSLYESVDFDVWHDANDWCSDDNYYKYAFESRVHFWMVLMGFIADKDDKESDYINHEKYTWKKSSDSTGEYEVIIVKKTSEV